MITVTIFRKTYHIKTLSEIFPRRLPGYAVASCRNLRRLKSAERWCVREIEKSRKVSMLDMVCPVFPDDINTQRLEQLSVDLRLIQAKIAIMEWINGKR
jgi:hypothetical protein